MQPPEGLQDQAVNFLLVRLGSTDLASGRCSNAMDMPGWQMESGPGHLRKQWRSQGRLLGGRGSRTEAGGEAEPAGQWQGGVCAGQRVAQTSTSTSRSLNPERPLGRWRQCEWPERGCSRRCLLPARKHSFCRGGWWELNQGLPGGGGSLLQRPHEGGPEATLESPVPSGSK